MKARWGFLLFCIIVGWGFWEQRRYMSVSRQEFLEETQADRSQSQLLDTEQFAGLHFEDGQLKSSIRADSGAMLNNGETIFNGNVKYIETDAQLKTKFIVSTSKAICYLEVEHPDKDFFDTSRRLEKAYLPKKVFVQGANHYLKTDAVTIDFIKDVLTTNSDISVIGPGQNLVAEGLTYRLSDQSFQLHKNIKGYYIPSKAKKQ